MSLTTKVELKGSALHAVFSYIYVLKILYECTHLVWHGMIIWYLIFHIFHYI